MLPGIKGIYISLEQSDAGLFQTSVGEQLPINALNRYPSNTNKKV